MMSRLPGLPASPPKSGKLLAAADAGGSLTPPTTVTKSHKGKEPIHEIGTEEEKKALAINISKARRSARSRLLAVGVFLSLLSISSKSLIESMRRIWQIRGNLESLQMVDKRFILEFFEEGDYNHVIKGGPWRYREDAVIIEPLKDGVVPESVKFSKIPIWVQFRKTPFYLLSKVLAIDLAGRVGSFICIDNFARGDICEKFIRARVELPIDHPLRRWIPIVDGISEEEVIVNLHYERLPNLCSFCGFIVHLYTSCTLPGDHKKKNYSEELGVKPTQHEDIKRWFLPDSTNQEEKQAASSRLPWRTQLTSKKMLDSHVASVDAVAREVENLSVNNTKSYIDTSPKIAIDKPTEGQGSGLAKANTHLLPRPTCTRNHHHFRHRGSPQADQEAG